jgi:hypothetical protein
MEGEYRRTGINGNRGGSVAECHHVCPICSIRAERVCPKETTSRVNCQLGRVNTVMKVRGLLCLPVPGQAVLRAKHIPRARGTWNVQDSNKAVARDRLPCSSVHACNIRSAQARPAAPRARHVGKERRLKGAACAPLDGITVPAAFRAQIVCRPLRNFCAAGR